VPVALQHLDGRRFPRAVRPEEREDLTLLHGQVDTAHRLNVPIPLAQPPDPDRDPAVAVAARVPCTRELWVPSVFMRFA